MRQTRLESATFEIIALRYRRAIRKSLRIKAEAILVACAAGALVIVAAARAL